MRCMMCESLSLIHICPHCQEIFLTPSIYKRCILDNTEVISFYKYSDIKELLHTKHTDLGYYIYSILAKNSFKKFIDNFEFQNSVASIAVDDHIGNGYSHTAILNKALRSKSIKPYFNKLRAKNRVSYSGKSKEFRVSHPREFTLSEFREKDVILVDDIITTGFTLNQAIISIKEQGKTPVLCLTLADASLK